MSIRHEHQIKRIKSFAQRSITHPRWTVENIRLAGARRKDQTRSFNRRDYEPFLTSQREAIKTLLNISETECNRALSAVNVEQAEPSKTTDPPTSWNATSEFMVTIGAIVRLTKPSVVVETGVARGYSSATILAALLANGRGHLHSVDLPALEVDAGTFVGSAVAEPLRERWTLHLGPSRHVLPKLLSQTSPIDMFIHDADHTYESQMEEFRTVWPHLRQGGILVADDIGNPAFTEFAVSVGAKPTLVDQIDKPFPFGIALKN